MEEEERDMKMVSRLAKLAMGVKFASNIYRNVRFLSAPAGKFCLNNRFHVTLI
jgi:hypothetical protein